MADRTVILDKEDMVGDIPDIKLEDGKLTQRVADTLIGKLRELINKVNGGISHGSGIDGHRGNLNEQFIDHITPATPDTEFVVPHGLKRVPIGVEIARKNVACVIYDSSAGSWDDKLLYLKATVGSVALKLRVY